MLQSGTILAVEREEDEFECPECWKHWDREQTIFCKLMTFVRHVVSLILCIFDDQNGYLPHDPAKGQTRGDIKQYLGVRDECKKVDENSNALMLMMLSVHMMKAKIFAPETMDNEMEVYSLPEETDPAKNHDSRKPTQTKLKLKRGITMDSGAGNNVMPRRMVIRKSDIRESEGSRNGVHYVAANNGRIPNEGEYDLQFNTVEGNEQCLTFQIAEVNKALCAVSNLVDRGYRVVFDKDVKTGQDTSYMMHKGTGVTTRFRRTRNVWVLDAFVDNKSGSNGQSFHRRG